MRALRSFLFVVMVFAPGMLFASNHDWLPVTPKDLQVKDVPGNPGAPAIRLYHAHEIDDNTFSEFVYDRIKILNDRGTTYADVEIPVFSDAEFGVVSRITNLKARTIHPDGSIVEFTGKPYEKTVFKGNGNKLAVKAFTLSEVSVGSIIEYKYELIYRSFAITFRGGASLRFLAFTRDEWDIQNELYTVKEHLYFRPYEGGEFKSKSQATNSWNGAEVSHVSFNLKKKPKTSGNEVELDLHDVPGFEEEDYMPPEDNYKPSVVFFYNPRFFYGSSTDKEWEEIGKDQFERLKNYLKFDDGVKKAAMQAIGHESDPLAQLQKLYARAQEVRNLSFERERSEEELKKENLRTNEGPADVLSRGYGTNQDITLLFIAMARAAGFEASPVRVTDRKQRFFAKEYTSILQIRHLIAAVKVKGSDMYFDPGTRFCPFGLLRWNYTGTDALKLDKKGGVFVKTPPPSYQKTATATSARVALAEDGSLKGQIAVSFQGLDALEHRIDGIYEDEEGRKKALEDEIKGWLPAGSVVKLAEAKGWEGSDSPLSGLFNIEIPGYASIAGKRLIVPAVLLQTWHKDVFKHADRIYPLYFHYPFTETDRVELTFPEGFSVESMPRQQDARLKYAGYHSSTQMNGSRLVIQRSLAFNAIYIPKDRYAEVRGFFSNVQQGDGQQAVLHKGGGVSAQKIN